MSQPGGPTQGPGPPQSVLAGYNAVIQLVAAQSVDTWSRFSSMLVANSVILAAIGFLLEKPTKPLLPKSVLAGATCVVGVLLCLAWWRLLARAISMQDYWYAVGRQLERHLPGVNLLRRGLRFSRGKRLTVAGTGLTVSGRWPANRWMYLVIGLFALCYVAVGGVLAFRWVCYGG